MKRTAAVLLAFFTVLCSSAFSQSLAAGIGVDFFQYKRSFLDIRAQYIHHLHPNVEIAIGSSFAITTKKQNGETEADFLVPLDVAFNFMFPLTEKAAYYFGLGLAAQVLMQENDPNRFYMGPFASLGIRLGIHPYLEWYAEARQDLLFGKPDWINTSTRLSTGVIFPL
jgi:hypothetical protein